MFFWLLLLSLHEIWAQASQRHVNVCLIILQATKSQSEMRDVATRICREYLTGAWKTVSSDEIQVKRIRWVEDGY